MIIFPEDTCYHVKFYEHKLGKDRLKSLEKVLRKLGNFDQKKKIEIINEEYIDYLENLYEVKDNDDTSFKFYNFGLGHGSDMTRYYKNFYLIMKRKNSDIEYTYDFDNYDKEKFDNKLNVIEIKKELSQDRIFKIQLSRYQQSIRLIIEESNKQYALSTSEKGQENIFHNFRKMASTVEKMETLNLEQILGLIENKKSILFAGINIDNEPKAKVKFLNGEILYYEIKDPDKEISVDIRDEITREVKREGYEPVKEKITENYEKIQTEIKRLLKQL